MTPQELRQQVQALEDSVESLCSWVQVKQSVLDAYAWKIEDLRSQLRKRKWSRGSASTLKEELHHAQARYASLEESLFAEQQVLAEQQKILAEYYQTKTLPKTNVVVANTRFRSEANPQSMADSVDERGTASQRESTVAPTGVPLPKLSSVGHLFERDRAPINTPTAQAPNIQAPNIQASHIQALDPGDHTSADYWAENPPVLPLESVVTMTESLERGDLPIPAAMEVQLPETTVATPELNAGLILSDQSIDDAVLEEFSDMAEINMADVDEDTAGKTQPDLRLTVMDVPQAERHHNTPSYEQAALNQAAQSQYLQVDDVQNHDSQGQGFQDSASQDSAFQDSAFQTSTLQTSTSQTSTSQTSTSQTSTSQTSTPQTSAFQTSTPSSSSLAASTDELVVSELEFPDFDVPEFDLLDFNSLEPFQQTAESLEQPVHADPSNPEPVKPSEIEILVLEAANQTEPSSLPALSPPDLSKRLLQDFPRRKAVQSADLCANKLLETQETLKQKEQEIQQVKAWIAQQQDELASYDWTITDLRGRLKVESLSLRSTTSIRQELDYALQQYNALELSIHLQRQKLAQVTRQQDDLYEKASRFQRLQQLEAEIAQTSSWIQQQKEELDACSWTIQDLRERLKRNMENPRSTSGIRQELDYALDQYTSLENSVFQQQQKLAEQQRQLDEHYSEI